MQTFFLISWWKLGGNIHAPTGALELSHQVRWNGENSLKLDAGWVPRWRAKGQPSLDYRGMGHSLAEGRSLPVIRPRRRQQHSGSVAHSGLAAQWHSVPLVATLTRVSSCLHYFSPRTFQQLLARPSPRHQCDLTHKSAAFPLDYNLWWLPLAITTFLCVRGLETRPHASPHPYHFFPAHRATPSPHRSLSLASCREQHGNSMSLTLVAGTLQWPAHS